ncbi:MAG TPA: hypothetical protein VFX47_00660 [Gammaproteobacteria bacterium]|nr:hypothetical protein [Gammaproteobacteria bacterium]
MKKMISIVALFGLICGCATVTQTPPLRVNPPSTNGEQWLISAKSDSGMLHDKITLYVNNTEVATGSLDPIHHKDIHISGDYRHHIVVGVCSIENSGDDRCVVSVDAYQVGMLVF